MDGFFIGVPGGEPLNPEQQAEIKRRKDLHDMAHEDMVRRQNEFIDSLDVEQLQMVKMMMVATISDEHDSFANHMLGWINARLHYEFKVCFACNKVHDELPTAERSASE